MRGIPVLKFTAQFRRPLWLCHSLRVDYWRHRPVILSLMLRYVGTGVDRDGGGDVDVVLKSHLLKTP